MDGKSIVASLQERMEGVSGNVFISATPVLDQKPVITGETWTIEFVSGSAHHDYHALRSFQSELDRSFGSLVQTLPFLMADLAAADELVKAIAAMIPSERLAQFTSADVRKSGLIADEPVYVVVVVRPQVTWM